MASRTDGGARGGRERCAWADAHPLLVEYHDAEWGVPLHDDRKLFEFLVLDAAQAGLSWLTVLRKREGYRQAFHGFDAERVAAYDEPDVERLLADSGIVRNRQKILSAVHNARALLAVQREHGSFDRFIWSFTGGSTRQNRQASPADLPASSPESEAMSRELRRRGFRFVGPTICYAFMQAAGMVNDHVVGCFRHEEVARLAALTDTSNDAATF
ncbi:MAG: DNA-3-methyladenine glycosylase I [Chthonomonadales bacterium]|nr:DNA-3-methyladenine glycosylase I [Chthonomonadales bacterium]